MSLPPAMKLKDVSDYALMRELERRLNTREVAEPERLCQECVFYKCQRDEKSNPCTRGHTLSFKMPEDYDFENYGFYRLNCPDFEAVPTPDPEPAAPRSPRPPLSRPKGVPTR